MKLTSVIVGGKNYAHDSLQDLLNAHASQTIQVISSSNSYFDALDKINRLKPNVLFLDIELDRGSAFNLLDKVSYYNYSVVFISSEDDFVIDALKYNTAYYILNPITVKQIKEAVAAVEQNHISHKFTDSEQLNSLIKKITSSKNNKFIEVHSLTETVDKISHVRCNSILYLKADSTRTELYIESYSESILSNKAIKHYEQILLEENFFRTHKSYLVNLTKVKHVIKSGGYYCELFDGQLVPISKNNVQQLYSKLQVGLS